jgi:ubiquinone/menaquinone biosynthesis C-methylase UbiE
MKLSDRQQREIDYHRAHASEHAGILEQPFDWSVLDHPARRWWNAYWRMYQTLLDLDVRSKRVLVVGCGFGDDALRLSKLGAVVSAFDLSADSLAIARRLAEREGLAIDFNEMPAEHLSYGDSTFDVIVARDILHHVDIPRAMPELLRVANSEAVFVINEIYSHSLTNVIRRSALVDRFLYPRMTRLIYGPDKPYITEDERKLTERDIRFITRGLQVRSTSYFNFLVTRLIPDRFDTASRVDRLLMKALHPVSRFLAGRVLITASPSDSSGR